MATSKRPHGNRTVNVPADHPELVTVDVAPPHAVYFDGEQRTGTITNVPWNLAVHWLRNRWANCAYGPPAS